MSDIRDKVKLAMATEFYNSPKGGPFPWDAMADAAIQIALQEASNSVRDTLFFKSCTCSFEAERAIISLGEK